MRTFGNGDTEMNPVVDGCMFAMSGNACNGVEPALVSSHVSKYEVVYPRSVRALSVCVVSQSGNSVVQAAPVIRHTRL